MYHDILAFWRTQGQFACFFSAGYIIDEKLKKKGHFYFTDKKKLIYISNSRGSWTSL